MLLGFAQETTHTFRHPGDCEMTFSEKNAHIRRFHQRMLHRVSPTKLRITGCNEVSYKVHHRPQLGVIRWIDLLDR